MFTKLQIIFGVLAGVAIVVFFAAIVTNVQVKQFGPVPDWAALVVMGSFGVIVICCIGTVVTQVLEFREPKEKKVKEEVTEEETAAGEPAAVGAATEETLTAGEATSEGGIIHEEGATTAFEPAGETSVETEALAGGEATEEFANFDDFSTDLPDLEEFK